MSAPTVALCVVAHEDDQHLIAECIASARARVDEVAVEICSDGELSAARNRVVAATSADWVLVLDAGECLDDGVDLRDLARQLPSDAQGYALRQRRGRELAIDRLAPRLYPRSAGLIWRGDVHEDLVFASGADAPRFVDAGPTGVIHQNALRSSQHPLIAQAVTRHPDDARLRYYLAESLMREGQVAEAAASFKTALQKPERLPRPLLIDAFAGWIETLTMLGDARGVERAARRAEHAQALSPAAREILADYYERRGRMTEARRQLTLALDPRVSQFGLIHPDGVGSWRTRLHLALVNERLGSHDRALDELARAIEGVPAEHRFTVALLAARLGVRVGAGATRPWLELATACAPEDVDAHTALLDIRLALPELIGDEPLGALDRDIATEQWQATYDAVMRMSLVPFDALARALHVAKCLRERGAADAALDILDRAIDVHPRTRALYWQLTSVLVDLNRCGDAQIALDVLQLLARENSTESQTAA